MPTRLVVRETAPGLFVARTPLVNWLLAVDGGDVLLIDSGYPGQLDAVLESIRRIGRRPGDVVAGLATHAHTDHIGGFVGLRATRSFPVHALAAELPALRREELHQVGLRALAPSLWRPRVLGWTVAAVRAGGLRDVAVADPVAAPEGVPLDLPGTPVLHAVPGHTPGSAVVRFPGAGLLATGDAAVTGHPALPRGGGGLVDLPAFFQHDVTAARAGRAVVEALPGQVVVPGHGPVLRRG